MMAAIEAGAEASDGLLCLTSATMSLKLGCGSVMTLSGAMMGFEEVEDAEAEEDDEDEKLQA